MRINITLVLFAFILLLFMENCSRSKESRAAQALDSHIIMICNRGENREAPENTFASACKAINCGAEYVAIDIRKSKDGIYYIIHDSTLDRTTNGKGMVSMAGSEYIDSLDAGSWFSTEFAGEKVPRLYNYLQWVKGKAKVCLNIKEGDFNEIIQMVYELEFENDCLFRFSNLNRVNKFRTLNQDLSIIINSVPLIRLDSLISLYNPRVVEPGIFELTDEYIMACHEKGIKVMASVLGNDFPGYRKALSMDVDMVYIDSPCIFSNMAENNGIFTANKLIAHRGGITGGVFNESSPASIQKAIEMGYYMIEVDIRKTKDGVLIVHHDEDLIRFFNDPRRVDEITWEEVKSLKSDKDDYHPLSFEEFAQMCSGRIKLMIDIKVPITERNSDFYKQLGEMMEKYNLLDGAYILGRPIEQFMGKAKMSTNIAGIPQLMEMLERGEEVASNYYIFITGTNLTSTVIKWAQQNSITVVAAINIINYTYENHWQGARRDIEFLKECGITEFQIDSHYDQWLPH